MFTYDDIVKASEKMKLTPIKGKDYIEVPERVKVFRKLCPMGAIETELIADDGAKCIMRAVVRTEDGNVLGSGTAFEMKDASFINKTSYIENCETSAVGRALAMCGIGIDTSITSAEELENALLNQKTQEEVVEDASIKAKAYEIINQKYSSKESIKKIAAHYGVEDYKDLSIENCKDFIEQEEKKNAK